ncbi:MAG: DUF4105 domain-containing protein [Planctomycetota bacterium]
MLLCISVASSMVAAEPPPTTPWSAFAPDRAALIYAAPAASGAAGMFGHVLILVHGKGGDIAVAWAANIGDDSIPALAWKGLFGGYTGGCETSPWDRVRRDYQRVERRTLWRYDLQLTDAEFHHLLDAIASEIGKRHAYRLLNDNCASGIAGLLDAARPAAQVRASLGRLATPLDVVRAAHAAKLIGVGVALDRDGQPAEAPTHDPIEDHRCGRIALSAGRDDHQSYVGLSVRPAWHAALDPAQTIPLGDALTVLSAEARWYEHDRVHLQQVDLLTVESLSQRQVGLAGVAWSAHLGSERTYTHDHGLTQHGVLAVGMGGSWLASPNALIYALALADARLVDDVAQPAAGLGVEAGLRYRMGPLTAETQIRSLAWGGSLHGGETRADVGLGLRLTSDLSIDISWGWMRAWGHEATQASFGLSAFF